MQSAETVLHVLRERGRRGLPLNKLYRLLFNPQLYLLAYGRIYSNKGAMTPGPDAETADGMTMGKRSGDIATQVSVSILRCSAAGFSRSGSERPHRLSVRGSSASSSTPRDASASRAARSGAPATSPPGVSVDPQMLAAGSRRSGSRASHRLSVRGSSAPEFDSSRRVGRPSSSRPIDALDAGGPWARPTPDVDAVPLLSSTAVRHRASGSARRLACSTQAS